MTHARGHHLLKAGGLVERYSASEFNPTFSRGVYRFASLQTFLAGTAASFIGLTPEGDVNRAWDWTLVGGYVQDDWAARRDLTINAGLRLEAATVPVDPRDVNMPDLLAPAPTIGPLYQNPGATFSPRLGAAWNVGGSDRTSRARRLRPLLHAQQPAGPDRHRHQPAGDAARGHRRRRRSRCRRSSGPAASRCGRSRTTSTIRASHMWNVNVQRAARRRLGGERSATRARAAGTCGATPTSTCRRRRSSPTARRSMPPGSPRPNPAFSAIELKASDGDSWYKALILEARRQWTRGLQVQTSYTWSKAEDTTQNATFFSDSTTALGVGDAGGDPRLQQGPVGLPRRAQLGAERDLADADRGSIAESVAGALLNDWQIATIVRMRSGNPLTAFVQTNRSRSLWAPSLGPGHRPRSPELRARPRSRGRRHRRSRPLVRSDGVRAAADRHVRQRRPQRPDRTRPAHDRPGVHEGRAVVVARRGRPRRAAGRDLQPLQPRQLRAAVAGRVQRHRRPRRRRSPRSARSARRSRRRGRCSWACASCSEDATTRRCRVRAAIRASARA